MNEYNFTHLTDLELEALDREVIKSLRAIKAYSNRALAKAKRAAAVEYLTTKSQAILAEQMRRDEVAA